MWLSKDLVGFFHISTETVSELRKDLAIVTAERDILKLQAAVDRTTADWLRTKVNGLELENKALLQKAYNINIPVPELIRSPIDQNILGEEFSFDHIPDDIAKKLGLPV